jgi:2-polyprenyl-3-methyl-5-hydroxy-6-metoxy-1,4-benzoquinol methylase
MENRHVCPWWLGYFLINPLRKYVHNPEKILGNYILSGMKVIDYGSAMGHFSLPMAKMVGTQGKVYCFDIQKKMLAKLTRRAKNAGMEKIIESRLITNDDSSYSDLKQTADFTLLFAVAHEISDREQLFALLAGIMKNKALLMFAEPAGHVSFKDFEQSVSLAEKAGFRKLTPLKINRSYAILFTKI